LRKLAAFLYTKVAEFFIATEFNAITLRLQKNQRRNANAIFLGGSVSPAVEKQPPPPPRHA
jgi:hypothetical protein